MMGLLVFKERLKAFYGKYSYVVHPVVKFVFSLTVFLILNTNLGFMTKLKNPVIPIVAALVCSFLPWSAMTCLAAVLMLAHLYSLSLELVVITGILVLIVAILYSGFQPGDSLVMVITPLMFFLGVPYAVPLLLGLTCGLTSMIPMCFGIFFYYLLVYAKQNAGVLAAAGAVDITQKYMQILKSLFGNETMLLMMLAFAAAVIVVFLIRNLSVDYAWSIATVAGTVVLLAVIFMGNSRLDVKLSIGAISVGTLLSVILAFILQFFLFAVDYTRTEFLQFQDDDYYYYVKAVPKIAVTAPDVKVQRINKRKDS
ncbi:MAG: ABC transporter permease [Lachnospiraceae bacterium]|nr:ABC transporter permease [Lachnospiraceae bacterium]